MTLPPSTSFETTSPHHDMHRSSTDTSTNQSLLEHNLNLPHSDHEHTPPTTPSHRLRRLVKSKYSWWCLVLSAVILCIAVILPWIWSVTSDASKTDSVAQCIAHHTQRSAIASTPPLNTHGNNLLITRATLLNGLGQQLNDIDIQITDGIIEAVSQPGERLEWRSPDVRINAQARYVTPGLFDLHSHAGMSVWPALNANDDTNEMTNPIFPQLRAVDAFYSRDTAIPHIREGGITTAQILPGSGNAEGGEGFIVKWRGDLNNTSDMIVRNADRLLKYACGENPKDVYGQEGKVGQTPMSRMGSAWLERQNFEAAQRLMEQQQAWCEKSSNDQPFPNELKLESTIALLRGKARLHNHCYQTHDMQMQIRLSDEFGFKVAAFHHALEAHLMAPLLANRSIAIATFSDLHSYKFEAFYASSRQPQILHDAGVATIIKSDHPVLDSRYLMFEAAKAFYYGLNDMAAIASVTYEAAKSSGLEKQLGSIQQGLDGDIVMWDRDPLTIGARPVFVVIDGKIYVNNSRALPVISHPKHTDINPDMTATDDDDLCLSSEPAERTCYAVQNVRIYAEPPAEPLSGATIVVNNGLIACIGASCNIPPRCARFKQPDGQVVPGFIQVGGDIGQIEIEAEESTHDGPLSGAAPENVFVRALDGLRSSHNENVKAAYMAGVLGAIAYPQGDALVGGQGVAYLTCCAPLVVDDRLLKNVTALHLHVGPGARRGGDMASSVSGQFATLRMRFAAATLAVNISDSDPLYLFKLAIQQKQIIAIHANQVDVIASALRLQNEFKFKLVIIGGAEAHLVAKRIAAAEPTVSVLLPARQPPDTLNTNHAVEDAAAVLQNAGVRVGLFVNDPGNARNLRWEAGMLIETQRRMLVPQALASISTNIVDMFELPSTLRGIFEGAPAAFTLFNGDWWSLRAKPQLVASGTTLSCRPRQR